MKKSFIIIPAIALLASCGGGQQTQQNTDTAANGRDGVHTVSTTETEPTQPIPDFPEPATNVAYEVALLLNPQAKKHQPADTASKVELSFEFEDQENYDLDPVATIRCMNHIDGGYIAIYQEKEELPDSHKFVKENGKETLAQVYTDVRYKKEDNEAFSAKLLDFLKKQGFMQ